MTLSFQIDREIRLTGGRLVVLLALVGSVAGCGVSMQPEASSTAALSGTIMGGQQPVSGASIMLYQAGATGPGTGALSMLTTPVFSDGNGDFSITNDYTCPTPTTQIYIVTRGGNPGLTGVTNNPAEVMMAALGDCGNPLALTTFITVDEVTTVAAAWALSQFMAPGAEVGASATNATGLRNAFAVANSLASTATGMAKGPSLPAGAQIETAKLYTLADAISVCVNSDGGGTCSPLFQAATVGGERAGEYARCGAEYRAESG